MRKTKIICTIGPACSDEKTISQLCLAGMNVARLNFSHGTHEQHLKMINTIKKVREELKIPIAIMLDTKGPEYRIGTFENGSITLQNDAEFTFTTEDVVGTEKKVSVSYKGIAKEMKKGDIIKVNDGLSVFEVLGTTDTDVICKTLVGGELRDRKSMSFPDKVLGQKYISEADKSDILFGIENDVDFLACSFVSCKQDLLDVKKILSENGGEKIDIIAKIENRSGVQNIAEICEQCDGIMVARGDLGVEIPFEELPAIQKQLIRECRLLGKRVITATEMLESMINNARPTRAEISDVANAVFDGTSAVMLSGETAAGKYPVLTVKTMAKIVEHAESTISYDKRLKKSEFKIKNMVDAISHSTCSMAIDIDAKVIAVCSLSGATARMVSRFRPTADILGLTTDEKTWRKLSLSWGVTPAKCEMFNSTDVLFYTAKNLAVSTFGLNKDDCIVITGGMTNGSSGNTNMIKVETV
ncbi:MAG: pyruvate kinase [Oscillospiraceae bacterium]|nr:pyruvate kinase [Oscillospiraceae bacterium]